MTTRAYDLPSPYLALNLILALILTLSLTLTLIRSLSMSGRTYYVQQSRGVISRWSSSSWQREWRSPSSVTKSHKMRRMPRHSSISYPRLYLYSNSSPKISLSSSSNLNFNPLTLTLILTFTTTLIWTPTSPNPHPNFSYTEQRKTCWISRREGTVGSWSGFRRT